MTNTETTSPLGPDEPVGFAGWETMPECEATDSCEWPAVAEVTDGGMYLLAVCEHHRTVALDRLGWAEA